MKPDENGKLPYRNIGHALIKTLRNEGFRGLYSGLMTYYIRLAPHAMLTLTFNDYLTDFVNKARGKGKYW